MNDEINASEQWLLDGDCKKCRRQRYCTKVCRKNRIATEREINAVITKAILKRFVSAGKEADDEY